ncbi:DUF7144 family membrane protein [Phaeacidiphilus oryzae]|jgi:hypothetical protein|uniref:DUF7144 family membrane protein n=1 Tax=Phaeacidiphilus oryzae TaxID=348818 RepID=UPI000561378F|nr:hypothetical protein [Phaeacidiphilus oryzae]
MISTGGRSEGAQTAAVGLTLFAAIMLFISGTLDFFRGLMGILEDKVFLTTRGYAFEFDLTAWGWIHLILGVIGVVVGAGLLAGMKWARILAIIIAGLLIIANFLSIPYYPFWSITVIALDALIIWGLCVVRRDDMP